MNISKKMKGISQENKIKRAKKDSRKLPKASGSGKGSKFIVWFILILIIVLSPLGFLRAQTALEKSKNAVSSVEEIAKGEGDREVDEYSSPLLKVFADDFVNKYMTIAKDQEEREAQQEKLKSYYAEGANATEIGDFKGYRQLDNKTLYNIEYKDDQAVMSYLVEYTNVSIEEVEEEKEVKKGKKKEKVKEIVEKEDPKKQIVMLNIPVRANKDGGYAVVEPPFYSNIPVVVNNSVKKVANPLEDENKIKTNETEEVKAWLEGFLADYANKSQDEMTYIMDEPKALDGKQEFVSIESISAYPSKGENRYTIKAVTIFKEKEVDITHQENFTITIEKSDGKFFVKEMKNTLGGN